jgi:hypothetical protein
MLFDNGSAERIDKVWPVFASLSLAQRLDLIAHILVITGLQLRRSEPPSKAAQDLTNVVCAKIDEALTSLEEAAER